MATLFRNLGVAVGVFVKLKVDPEVHNLTWPNGADFAPEFLHHKVAAAA